MLSSRRGVARKNVEENSMVVGRVLPAKNPPGEWEGFLMVAPRGIEPLLTA